MAKKKVAPHQPFIGEVEDFNRCYTAPHYTRGFNAKRYDYAYERRYYNEKLGWCKGVSPLVDILMVISRQKIHLDKWRDQLSADLGGKDQFKKWMGTVMDMGTLTHEAMNMDAFKPVTQEGLREMVVELAHKYELKKESIPSMVNYVAKAILSIRKFYADYSIEVLAMEQMVGSRKLRTMTPIDILATGRYKGNNTLFLINLKTSDAGGHSPAHEWQCAIEYYCALESLPIVREMMGKGYQVRVFTLRTIDWDVTGFPQYELQDYTDAANNSIVVETIESVSHMLQENKFYAPPTASAVLLDPDEKKGYRVIDVFENLL